MIPWMAGLHQEYELGVLDDREGPPFLGDPLHDLGPAFVRVSHPPKVKVSLSYLVSVYVS